MGKSAATDTNLVLWVSWQPIALLVPTLHKYRKVDWKRKETTTSAHVKYSYEIHWYRLFHFHEYVASLRNTQCACIQTSLMEDINQNPQ